MPRKRKKATAPHGELVVDVNRGQILVNRDSVVHAPRYVAGDYVVAYGLAASAGDENADGTAPRARAVIGSPLPPSPLFVGRDALLADIVEKLEGETAAGIRIVALTGLGGIGKTELVVEYAARAAASSLVFWIDASSRSAVTSQFASIAPFVGVTPVDDTETTKELVRAALGRRSDYVLVFDGATDSSAVRGLLPTAGSGRILMTSVNPNWRDIAAVLPIGPLDDDNSAALLQRRAGDAKDPVGAARLALALGNLPLALTQAGAYCEQSGQSFHDYLEMLLSNQPHLWTVPLSERGAKTMDTVWAQSLRALTERSRVADGLLKFLAYVPPSGIPIQDVRRYWPEITRSVFNIQAAEELDVTLMHLRRYSLISTSSSRVSVHPLLAIYMRGHMSMDWRRRTVSYLLRRASAGLPAKSWQRHHWPMAAPAADQILALGRYIQRDRLSLKLLASAYDRAARFYSSRWRHEEAAEASRLALEIGPRTPTRLLRLAYDARHSGKSAEATEYFEELLARLPPRIKNAGQSSNRIRTFASYATSLLNSGRFDQAVEWYESAILEAEATFGHPSSEVAAIRGRLAAALRTNHQFKDAEQQFLAALEELHAAGHVGTIEVARTCGSLGRCYAEWGKPERAAPYAEEAVWIKRALVPSGAALDDPTNADLAQSLLGLAAARALLGDVTACRQALGEATEIIRSRMSTNGAELCQVTLIGAQLARSIDAVDEALGFARRTEELALLKPDRYAHELKTARRLIEEVALLP